MEVNKIHNINFLENTLPDKCANLIIADPPYCKTPVMLSFFSLFFVRWVHFFY